MPVVPQRRWGLLAWLVMLSLSTACISHDHGPQRPEPDSAAQGTVVASIEVEDTRFVMHDEGDGIVAVEVIYRGLQQTVARARFDQSNILTETDTCGWLIEPNPEAGDFECDVELPRVFFGRVTNPEIGHVCVGTIENFSGGFNVREARIIEFDDEGFMLSAARPDESSAPHLFTAAGSQYGEPPLDAPSAPIYEACEAVLGSGQSEHKVWIDLWISLDDSIPRDDRLRLLVTAGLFDVGVSLGAFEGEESVPLTFSVTPTATRFSVEIYDEGKDELLMSTNLKWPDEIEELLAKPESCNGLTILELNVEAGVLDGEDDLALRFGESECSPGG